MQANTLIHGLLKARLIEAEEALSRTWIPATHGVINVVPKRPFYTFVSNRNDVLTERREDGKIAIALGLPESILYITITQLFVIFWVESDAASDVNTILMYEGARVPRNTNERAWAI